VKVAALADSKRAQSPCPDELPVSPGSGGVTYGLLGCWASRFPFGDASYSLTRVVWKTAQGLRRRGARTIVAGWGDAHGNPDGIDFLPVDGRPDHGLRVLIGRRPFRSGRVRWTSRLSHPYHLLHGVAALRRAGADAIQVSHEFVNLRPARLLAGKAPLITLLHAVWVDDCPELVKGLLEADAIATVSDYVRQALIDVDGRLAGRVTTVRNGVDLDEFPGRPAVVAEDPEAVRSWRRRLDALDRPLILAVGRVAAEKGIHVLAAAGAVLVGRRRDAVIAVAGDIGPYERPGPARHPHWSEIARLSTGYAGRLRAAAGASHFSLLGRVTRSEVRQLLAAADIFVAPSVSPEPFGLPVLEALAMDVPVVASDSGAFPEIVGKAAILVPPGDHGALADVLEALLEHTAERERLAAAARVQAAHHTWNATAAQLANLVAELR
jgi:glycosyltransferase involved in cell wall biosynthesis